MLTIALGLALALGGSQEQEPEPGVPLELAVNRTIALAVDYLRGRQAPDGSFPGHEGSHPGGATALVAFALAEAGVRRGDEVLVKALRALDGVEMQSNYSASVHLLMCEAMGDWGEHRAAAQRSLDFLVANQSQGVWAYPWGHLCGSNTQFVMVALRAAHRMGLVVPEDTLVAAAEGMWHFQDRSGGGLYSEGGRPYAAMTAALLSDFAVLEELSEGSTLLRGALRRHQRDRKAAEEWLAERFDITRNTYSNGTWTPFWHYAYMWAVERWCGITGREEFEGHDWYREGAAWLVDTQSPDGSWTSDDKPLENTCLALLFLRRATVSTQGELEAIYAELDRSRFEGRPPERAGPEARRLTDWWLAGPWQGKEERSILLEPPFEPARQQPRARSKLARREWERVSLKPEGWTDLHELTKREGDLQLWALVTTLAFDPPAGAPQGPVEAWLWLELEDGWEVWLDDRRLSRELRRQAAINGDVRIPLELTPGEHRLVVLVEDAYGLVAFGARLTDAANGPPPAGLSAWAEPPE